MTKYQKRISGPMLDRKVPRVRGGKVPRARGGKVPRARGGKVPRARGGIDIHTLSRMGFSGIEVPRVDYEKLSSDRLGESSASIRERVQVARERQQVRFEGTDIVCPVQEPGLSQFRHARGGSKKIL